MKVGQVLVAAGLLFAGACRGAPLPGNDLAGRQGFVARPCGFDLNHNGIFGEADDCHVCDGRTRDPDHDGVAENLIYVDCGAGADGPACGTPAAPCRSLEFAFASRFAADGAAGGAENILCFRGVCRPQELEPPRGGLPETYPLPRRGSEAREFLLPRQPAMLVGWDHDADGDYPPHDPDDLAVFDGSAAPASASPPAAAATSAGQAPPPAGLTFAFRLGSRASYFEMAHFEAKNYGRDTTTEQSGFVVFGSKARAAGPAGGHRADAFFFHDLRLSGINAGQPAQSHRIVFNYFTSATRFHHLYFYNLDLPEVGGFMVRGSGPDRPGSAEEGGNDGPFRWQNLSVTARGCNHSDPACVAGGGSAFIGWKMWGYIDGIEVLDSSFDANVKNWEPKPDGNGGALFVNATQCSRGWTIRNNAVRDFKVALIAQGGNGAYCGYDTQNDPPRRKPRPTGDIVFENNFFWNTYAPWRSGDMLVQLKGGEDQNRTLGEVTIKNNLLASTDGFDACIRIDVDNAGGPPPGQIAILGNTCWGSRAVGRSTGLWIGSGQALPFVQEKIELRGNIFGGFGPEDENARFDSLPKELETSGNVFDPDAPFELGGRKLPGLEALQKELAASSSGLSGRSCEPVFADPSRGLFTLEPGPCQPR